VSTATPTTEAEPRRRLSPRQRARVSRLVQYAVLVALVGLAIAFADWGQIVDVFFRPDLVVTALTTGMANAILKTVIYTVGAFVFGLVAGTVLALMRLSSVGPYRWMASAYIEFFRGLPVIIVLIAISLLPLAFPGMVFPLDPYGPVWLGLGMSAAAYMAETIRAGILAVPKGHVEAARSLGMPAWLTMRKIVLPQAFRIILPPLTNELILLVKDSSLVFVIGVSATGFELTGFGRDMANSNANLTPLVIAGFCYLIITLPLTALSRWLERSAAKAR
jgi:polar amino acid transport system permease protein